MLNAVCVALKLDVTLAVIGMSTTAIGVVDALDSGFMDAAGTGGVFEAVAVGVVGAHVRTAAHGTIQLAAKINANIAVRSTAAFLCCTPPPPLADRQLISRSLLVSLRVCVCELLVV
jgi:hypothetical protein